MLSESIKKSELTPLPNTRPKHKESLEIAALTAEFLAKGGKIKTAKGHTKDYVDGFVINGKGECYRWPERQRIIEMMTSKQITQKRLAAVIKKPLVSVKKWLTAESTPDMQERELIKSAIERIQ